MAFNLPESDENAVILPVMSLMEQQPTTEAGKAAIKKPSFEKLGGARLISKSATDANNTTAHASPMPAVTASKVKTCCLIFCGRRTKILGLQPPRQLKTLDDLLAQAVHYATYCMGNSGKMAPTLFLIGADGPLMFATGSLADEDEKDAFATNARLLCIACAESGHPRASHGRPGDAEGQRRQLRQTGHCGSAHAAKTMNIG